MWRTFIITPMKKWKHVATNINNELVVIEAGLGHRNIMISCVYLSSMNKERAYNTIDEYHNLVRADNKKTTHFDG